MDIAQLAQWTGFSIAEIAKFAQIGGSLNGMAGSWLLAFNCKGSKFGWILFLISNVFWLAFAYMLGFEWLLLQTASFTASSALGVWNYVLVDRYPALPKLTLRMPHWLRRQHA